MPGLPDVSSEGFGEDMNLDAVSRQGWLRKLGIAKPARFQALKKKVKGEDGQSDEEGLGGALPGIESPDKP